MFISEDKKNLEISELKNELDKKNRDIGYLKKELVKLQSELDIKFSEENFKIHQCEEFRKNTELLKDLNSVRKEAYDRGFKEGHDSVEPKIIYKYKEDEVIDSIQKMSSDILCSIARKSQYRILGL